MEQAKDSHSEGLKIPEAATRVYDPMTDREYMKSYYYKIYYLLKLINY